MQAGLAKVKEKSAELAELQARLQVESVGLQQERAMLKEEHAAVGAVELGLLASQVRKGVRAEGMREDWEWYAIMCDQAQGSCSELSRADACAW